ncbi:MAG: PHP-associated domain-containing protein [Candidatus Woesearchaeota archaeon]|jgi:hypothetical protein|nr:PHP-associated domain-containing protein [Candidatus Woesearchaeota archaeon]|tara:strand:+ start:867 stop:1661 length:795 start_codon:yes stop_codon:yes gene_type:complete
MNKALQQKPEIDKLNNEGYGIVDMHVHSDYSCDGAVKVDDLLKKARQLGIGLAITDHNKIEGSIEAARKSNGVLIIPGIELRSREGIDILIYFYKISEMKDFYGKHIQGNRKRDVQGSSRLNIVQIVETLKKYRCLVCIAHPYRFYLKKFFNIMFKTRRNKELFKLFETIEVINGKNLRRKNKKAIRKANQMSKHFVAGSDAHRLKDVGNAVTCCKGANTVEEFLDHIVKNRNVIVAGKEAKLSYKVVGPLMAMRNALFHWVKK